MSRACLICYELDFCRLGGRANSPVAQETNTLIQYLTLIKNDTFQIPFQEFINAGIYSCNNCSKTLELLCDLYHEKKKIEIRLSNNVSALESIMSRAGTDSYKLEIFRAGPKNLNVSVDEIVNFRNEVIKNSVQMLKTPPPLPLPTPPPGIQHRKCKSEFELQTAAATFPPVRTPFLQNCRAWSTSSSTPTNTKVLDRPRTRETVTCQSSSSFPLDVKSSDYKSSPIARKNAAATIEHNEIPLMNWFESELTDKLRDGLTSKNKLTNDKGIMQLKRSIAETGNISMQGSSPGKGETASSLTKNRPSEDMNLDEVSPNLGNPPKRSPKQKSVLRMASDHRHPYVGGPRPLTTSVSIGNQFICKPCVKSFPTYISKRLHLKLCQKNDKNSASNYSENLISPVPLPTPAVSNPYMRIPQTSVSDLELQLQNEAKNADEDSSLSTDEFPH